MASILALDQGTTSSRAICFEHDGTIAAVAQREFPQHFPRPGWVEHDPRDILQSQIAVAAEALSGTAEIAAIGITTQRETTILWDRSNGTPVANAIVWQDRRTAELCTRLEQDGLATMVQQRTGLIIDPYFSATKIRWLLDSQPGLRARAERGEIAFGTVDSWLVWHLTGGRLHRTDVSNASRTMLFDIHRGCWDPELLDALGIPPAILPEVRSSSEIYGETSCAGLPRGIPIAGIAGDQQAALFGQRCVNAGMVKTTYGTGSFIVMNTGASPIPSRHRLLSTIAWKIGDALQYALEGSVFVAGAVVQWLRDGLGLISTSAEVEQLAASVPDSAGVFFVPAFTGLGAPHWDSLARGALVGLTRGVTRGHIARAALEGIAFQVTEVLAAMEQDSGLEVSEMRVDGGASVNDLLMQMQADLSGVPVVRPASSEATALGAAFLAGLATGFWRGDEELDLQWRKDRLFEPGTTGETRQAKLSAWREAVERSKGWEEHAVPVSR